MMLSALAGWLSRNASMTVPICLYVSRICSRSGLNVVNPAASCPRFCRSRRIRGISRETSSGPPSNVKEDALGPPMWQTAAIPHSWWSSSMFLALLVREADRFFVQPATAVHNVAGFGSPALGMSCEASPRDRARQRLTQHAGFDRLDGPATRINQDLRSVSQY